MSELTISAALDRYLSGHVERHTAAPRRARIAADHLRQVLGACPVAGLSDNQLHAYADQRGVADSTIRRELGVLRAALRYCVKQRLIAEADLPYIALPAAAPPKDQWLTESQVRAMLNCFGSGPLGRGERFIIMALATGSRRRAIELLTWDLIDLELREVQFDKLPLPQTKKRRVRAPIPEWAVPWLRRARDERSSEFFLDNTCPIRTPFETTMRRVAEMTGDLVYLQINRHALRHTYGTLSLRAGVPLWQVAGLLGDTVETTAAVYGHHAQDNLRQAANTVRF